MSREIRQGEKYYKIENYSMKCRLYAGKATLRNIDRIINGVQKAFNIAVYDIITNHTNTKEFVTEDGSILHYVDLYACKKADYLNWLRTQHPDIPYVPGGAMSGPNGLFLSDLKKAMSHKATTKKTASGRVVKTNEKKARTSGGGSLQPYPLEHTSIRYYSSKKPRTSYTYQETLSKISGSENRNVLYIKLSNNTGTCKIRGWNQNIRFDESGKMDFLEYARNNPKKQITITISKDGCGDYWIVFKLQNVYKPMAVKPDAECGVDVGVKDIAICSDETKFENKKFKKQEKDRLTALQRRLCRSNGWSNIDFREVYKSDHSLAISRGYMKTQEQIAKLHRQIKWKRDSYNHEITSAIIRSNGFIGLESLNVSSMYRNRRISNALSDAAIGSILEMLKYKAKWYDRTIASIDRWEPSSKRCNCCGYIRPKLSLSVREWVCPKCGSKLDRDVNAARNILYYAKNLVA